MNYLTICQSHLPSLPALPHVLKSDKVKYVALAALALLGAALIAGSLMNVIVSGTLPVVAGIVMIVAAAILVQPIKMLKYKISLAHTILPNWMNEKKNPWSQPIINGFLALGAIPLQNRGHVDQMMGQNITAVLTSLEEFEMTTNTFFSRPVQAATWKEKKIDHKIIDTPDFEPVALEKIKEGVEWIFQEIKRGKYVYVHCKAGRGRSATIVVAYLLKYGNEHGIANLDTVDQAIAYVKERRPRINLNVRQRAALDDYFADMKKSNT